MPDYPTVFLSGYEGGVLVDESDLHQTVTKYGTTDLSSAQAKYGTQSLHSPVSGATYGPRGISVPHHPAMDLGSRKFTVESFVRWEAVPVDTGGNIIIGQSEQNVAGTGSSWALSVQYGALDPHGGSASLFLSETPDDSGEYLECYNEAYPFVINTWYHIAADFDGFFYRVYIQGNLVAFEPAVAWPVAVADCPLTIGTGLNEGVPQVPLYGVYLDETRLIVGQAVYATNTGFTPPTAPHPRGSTGPAPSPIYAIGGTPANPSCDHNLQPPDPSPTPGPTPTPTPPPGDIIMAVSDFDTGTTTATPISYSFPLLTGLVPKALLLVGTSHEIANGSSEKAGAIISFGAAANPLSDPSFDTGQRAISIASTDASTIARSFDDGRVDVGYVLRHHVGITRYAEGTVGLVSGGFTMTYNTANANRRPSFLAFAGSDVTAGCATVDLGSSTSPVTVTLGFQADVVFLFSQGENSFGGGGNDIHSTWGIITRDGTQRCVLMSELDQDAAGNPKQAILTDSCGGRMLPTGALGHKIVGGGFTSTGFTLTPSASTSGMDIAYLALKLNGRRVKLGTFDTPTATGNHTIMGVGFTPQTAIAFVTNLTATDPAFPLTTGDDQSGLAVCTIANEQWSHAIRIDSGADPTDTASFSGNYAMIQPSATDCKAGLATFVGWTSDGVTLNWSVTQGVAKKGIILFIE